MKNSIDTIGNRTRDRLIEQCLNQLRHGTPPYFVDGGRKYLRNLGSYISLHAAPLTKHVYLHSPSVKTADLYPTFFTMLSVSRDHWAPSFARSVHYTLSHLIVIKTDINIVSPCWNKVFQNVSLRLFF
jgi:hypothetical protein